MSLRFAHGSLLVALLTCATFATTSRADDAGAAGTNPVVATGLVLTGSGATVATWTASAQPSAWAAARPFGTAVPVDGTAGINLAECESNAVVELPVAVDTTVAAQTGWDTLEIFVSADGLSCAPVARRASSLSGAPAACQRVASFPVGTGGASVSTLYVPAFALVDAAGFQRGVVPSAAADYASFGPTFATFLNAAAPAIAGGVAYPTASVSCNPPLPDMAPTALYVDILAFLGESIPTSGATMNIIQQAVLTDGTQDVAAGTDTSSPIELIVGTTYDVIGPPAPTALTLTSADSTLYAAWTPPSSTDITGSEAYCFPSPLTTVADAGTDASFGDAGADATADSSSEAAVDATVGDTSTTTAAGCPSGAPTWLQAGAVLSSTYAGDTCASRTSLGESLVIGSLDDGSPYAVLVALTDLYGNEGPLSGASCATPSMPVTVYDASVSDAQADAETSVGDVETPPLGGGVSCSLQSRGADGDRSTGVVVAMGALFGLALSRRRQRSASSRR